MWLRNVPGTMCPATRLNRPGICRQLAAEVGVKVGTRLKNYIGREVWIGLSAVFKVQPPLERLLSGIIEQRQVAIR